MTDCVYCGCSVEAHDPVFVLEGDARDRDEADPYCNYACLTAHVEEAGLTTGATCEIEL